MTDRATPRLSSGTYIGSIIHQFHSVCTPEALSIRVFQEPSVQTKQLGELGNCATTCLEHLPWGDSSRGLDTLGYGWNGLGGQRLLQ